MAPNKAAWFVCVVLCVFVISQGVSAQDIKAKPVDKWVTAEAAAAGADEKAKDQAVARALRAAVEQACGVFLKAQSKTRDYKVVYDKIFADTVGYVREYKLVKTYVQDQKTYAKVNARVSTRKFAQDWAAIAHTVNQENNPRVIIAVVEAIHQNTYGPVYEVKEAGIVQGIIENFFLARGLTLMDRSTAQQINKRDVLLAVIKDDTKAIAALGARFKADVVVIGRATAKFGRQIEIAEQKMYQYTATLNIRAIRTDSAQVLVSQSFGPITTNTTQRAGGEDKVLKKLADQCAPKTLTAVVEAWSKQINVARQIQLTISGMDYATWKVFQAAAGKLEGVQALRLREITEEVANIDVEYSYSNENLADHLLELTKPKLTVTEITANRIKLKVVK